MPIKGSNKNSHGLVDYYIEVPLLLPVMPIFIPGSGLFF
jgi:hypothetical protein